MKFSVNDFTPWALLLFFGTLVTYVYIEYSQFVFCLTLTVEINCSYLKRHLGKYRPSHSAGKGKANMVSILLFVYECFFNLLKCIFHMLINFISVLAMFSSAELCRFYHGNYTTVSFQLHLRLYIVFISILWWK